MSGSGSSISLILILILLTSEQVLIDSTEPTQYTIDIPSQGSNTFSSFLMYVVERDQPVMVTDIRVETSGGSIAGDSEPAFSILG